MLIITISSAIATWLWLIPGGFWLVSWFAVLVVMVANNYLLLSNGFAWFRKISSYSNWAIFMEAWLCFFSRSVTLWIHFADLFWYHVLEKVSSLMVSFCPFPGKRISFNRFRCIQKLLSNFEFSLNILHGIFVLTL